MKSTYFWTDVEQATERLLNTVVLYENKPVYIQTIEANADGIPRAIIYECKDKTKTPSRKMLNSPHFARFRDLPTLGWVNRSSGTPIFLARRTMTARIHGLSGANVTCTGFQFNEEQTPAVVPGADRFPNLMFDTGFVQCHDGEYPSLDSVLSRIKPGTAIAVTNVFCVARDRDGVRWLYRDLQRVGIFTGNNTLNLISRYLYLREEIQACKAMTMDVIQEF